MAQPSVASFFNSRKRAAGDGIAGLKNKILTGSLDTEINAHKSIKNDDNDCKVNVTSATTEPPSMRTRSGRTIKRSDSQQSEPDVVPRKISKIEQHIKQKKLSNFIKKGAAVSKQKNNATDTTVKEIEPEQTKVVDEINENNTIQYEMQKANEATPSTSNTERGLRTPTKQIIKGSVMTSLKQGEIKRLVKKELKFDEVKTKITRSAKLEELKASLGRIQELEKVRKAQNAMNKRLENELKYSPGKKESVVQLKEFDKIDLEVLTSPQKTFKTPTKLPPKTPDKNELMSPRHTDISKRLLFSPAKDGSPSKLIVPPAYQRFASLADSSKAGQLPLPYKYRHLYEIFKAVDSVCAMFHNRKECITFKKLKPAIQRILRKNFHESHLAQIKHLYPEAFVFTQMKMRNYGSTSKADYFQLVITPNIDNKADKYKIQQLQLLQQQQQQNQFIDEENAMAITQFNIMNPQILTERMQHFKRFLLLQTQIEHDKFLKSLDPPLLIPKEKVTRWHPEFDLENCSDIECGHLPQPPNVEKYSSARDILSTARNLFNCSTPMERVMERYEAKMKAEHELAMEGKKQNVEQMQKYSNDAITATKTIAKTTNTPATKTSSISILTSSTTLTSVAAKAANSETSANASTTTATATTTTAAAAPVDINASLLKGLPKSLIEKIRAKQAAKALDAMTRRPSQDVEATKYTRLPELARHLRNVYITERKGVLTLEFVINKIQNSFRTCLTAQEFENHLQLLAKEVPEWIGFHEVRKTMYLKIDKNLDLKKIIAKLEAAANEKTK